MSDISTALIFAALLCPRPEHKYTSVILWYCAFKEEFQSVIDMHTMSYGWWRCRIPYNILMKIIAGRVVRYQSPELASRWTCRGFELCYKTHAVQYVQKITSDAHELLNAETENIIVLLHVGLYYYAILAFFIKFDKMSKDGSIKIMHIIKLRSSLRLARAFFFLSLHYLWPLNTNSIISSTGIFVANS